VRVSLGSSRLSEPASILDPRKAQELGSIVRDFAILMTSSRLFFFRRNAKLRGVKSGSRLHRGPTEARAAANPTGRP
jgi:hypothetical protein